ncbi:MAG: hypothetical protein F4Z14_09040 [Gammaproteobacteria bacterium]|nr:hypothetical protein [Gammaproteobacteria bacterium]
MKIFEKLSRLVQGTAVTIALGMLTVGTFAYTTPQPSEADQPNVIHDMVVSNPECAVYLEPSKYPSDDVYFSVLNAAESGSGFFSCWFYGTAQCGPLGDQLCLLYGAAIQLLLLPFTGILAVIKLISKKLIKATVNLIIKTISKLPKVKLPFTKKTIDFGKLGKWLLTKNVDDVVDWLLLSGLEHGKRICECTYC